MIKILSLIVLFVVLAGGIITLHSPTFHRTLLQFAQKDKDYTLSVTGSRLDLLRGGFTLTGLSIQGNKFLLTTDRLYVRLSLLSLVSGRLIIKALEIDRPHLIFAPPAPSPKERQPLSHLIGELFDRLDRSFLIQNTILNRIVIRDLILQRENEKTPSLKLAKAVLTARSTFHREIELEMHLEDLGEAPPTLRSADLEIKLGRSSLSLKGDFDLPKILADPLKLEVQATWEKEIGEIRKIEAHLGKGRLEGKGQLSLATLAYKIVFAATDVTLESLFQRLTGPVLRPAQGVAVVEGEAIGRLPHIAVKARARINNLRHGPLSLREAAGTVALDWPTLSFEAEVKPGSDGKKEGDVRGAVDFKPIAGLEKLQAILKRLDVELDGPSLQDLLPASNVSGRLKGTLHLEGVVISDKGPEISPEISGQGKGHAEVTEGRWALGPVDSLVTDIAFRPGGEIVFNNTRLRFPNFREVSWPGPIELDTSGGEQAPIPFSGNPIPGLSFKGRYEKGPPLFLIDSFHLQQEGNSLIGSLRVVPSGPLEARLKGDCNLSSLLFFPTLFREARGIAHLDLTASGSVAEPVIRGRVEFQSQDKVEIEFRGFPEGISDLAGTIVLDGSTLSSDLRGLVGDGAFKLGGHLRLAQWRPESFDLQFHGTNLTLSRPGIYRIDLDTGLSLRGPVSQPTLEGRIDIVDGGYTKKFVVRDFVLKPFQESIEPAPWEKTIEPLQLRLSVQNSGDLRIKNNLASILLKSDLKIAGTYGHPRISGAFTATEGVFTYLGKNFELNEGRLEFLDPAGEVPYLTLQAQQKIPPNYTVFVSLRGPLSNLEVALASSPSLPRDEILSLIVAGLTQEEIRSGARSRDSLTTGILAEEISSILERPLTSRTGLDIFRLEASKTGRLSVLSLGKNVTDRFSLEFRNDLAPETAEQTLQANYNLTDNFLLKGFRTRTASTIPRYQFNVSFRLRLN